MALTLLAQRPSQERSPYGSPGCSAVKRVHLMRVVDDRRCMGPVLCAESHHGTQ